MPQPPNPTEGQFFTLQPVPPPEPKATTHWGLPLALGLLSIPLLMFGFGFSQQQLPAITAAVSPAATPSVSPLPTPSLASQQDATTPQPPASATPPLEPSPLAALSSDPATLPIAHIHSPGMAANFRASPSLHSQVMGVLMHGDLVELPPERRVQQDGVVWVPVRWRGQTGWLASNFLGERTHAQP